MKIRHLSHCYVGLDCSTNSCVVVQIAHPFSKFKNCIHHSVFHFLMRPGGLEVEAGQAKEAKPVTLQFTRWNREEDSEF